MSAESKIEWTNATWNPTTGCTKISPGCAHCYIERTPPFRIAGRKFVNGKIPMILHEDRLDAPLHWKKPKMIFVNSLSDLFHDDVPDEFIDEVFGVMAMCPQHTFQVLTKRADRMESYFAGFRKSGIMPCLKTRFRDMPDGGILVWPLPNVWLGVSVENRQHGLPRIEHLLKTPAAVRFLSVEPLLESVDLDPFLFSDQYDRSVPPNRYLADVRPDWVIVGGESGPGARQCDVEWIRLIRDQCRAAGVPCFIKQLGSNVTNMKAMDTIPGARKVYTAEEAKNPTKEMLDGLKSCLNAATVTLADRKGGDPSEWPEDLRVREMPKREGVTA